MLFGNQTITVRNKFIVPGESCLGQILPKIKSTFYIYIWCKHFRWVWLWCLNVWWTPSQSGIDLVYSIITCRRERRETELGKVRFSLGARFVRRTDRQMEFLWEVGSPVSRFPWTYQDVRGNTWTFKFLKIHLNRKFEWVYSFNFRWKEFVHLILCQGALKSSL